LLRLSRWLQTTSAINSVEIELNPNKLFEILAYFSVSNSIQTRTRGLKDTVIGKKEARTKIAKTSDNYTLFSDRMQSLFAKI